MRKRKGEMRTKNPRKAFTPRKHAFPRAVKKSEANPTSKEVKKDKSQASLEQKKRVVPAKKKEKTNSVSEKAPKQKVVEKKQKHLSAPPKTQLKVEVPTVKDENSKGEGRSKRESFTKTPDKRNKNKNSLPSGVKTPENSSKILRSSAIKVSPTPPQIDILQDSALGLIDELKKRLLDAKTTQKDSGDLMVEIQSRQKEMIRLAEEIEDLTEKQKKVDELVAEKIRGAKEIQEQLRSKFSL